jgi:hypothetical protein
MKICKVELEMTTLKNSYAMFNFIKSLSCQFSSGDVGGLLFS